MSIPDEMREATLPFDMASFPDEAYFDCFMDDVNFLDPVSAVKPYNIQKLTFPVSVTMLLRGDKKVAKDLACAVVEKGVFWDEVQKQCELIKARYPKFTGIGANQLPKLLSGQPFTPYKSLLLTKTYNRVLMEKKSDCRLGAHSIVISSLLISNAKEYRGGIRHGLILEDLKESLGISLDLNQYKDFEKGKALPWHFASGILNSMKKLNPGNVDLKNDNKILVQIANNVGRIKVPTRFSLVDYRANRIENCSIAYDVDRHIKSKNPTCIDLTKVLRYISNAQD